MSFIVQKPDQAKPDQAKPDQAKPDQAKPDQAKPDQKNFLNGYVLRPFFTVALIGPDGSGKSSVAKALLVSCPLPMKYLYMGASIESSNVSLPTSRLVHRWKVYQHKRSMVRSGKDVPDKITLHGLEHRIDRRGKLCAIGRLFRRVSEEVYRMLVSWMYQICGNVVLYDRHFLFDSCPNPIDFRKQRFTDRVHCLFLRKLYPRPGLVILLDAPAEVLYARKQEIPVEQLEQARQDLAQNKCYSKNIVTVDTTKPFDEVVEIVNNLILEYGTTWPRSEKLLT